MIPRESESLLNLIKDISVTNQRLEETAPRKRRSVKSGFAFFARRGSQSFPLRTMKAIARGLPALIMGAFVAGNVFGTRDSAARRNARFENAFAVATRAGDTESLRLLLGKRLVTESSDSLSSRMRYLQFLIDSGEFGIASKFARGIPHDGSERSGELQTLAASVLKRTGIDDNRKADEFESRLVIAIADPATASRARAMLGRFYRERGQFEACESVLEPIRASEQGCLELALLREAQGHYGDIPTTLAPYLVRWRERWLAPQSENDIETSAEALILMNQESVVLETLDAPPVSMSQDKLDRIRKMAAKSLLDREFRSGTLRLSNALEEVDRHFDRLPCSEIWIEPIIRLTARDAPTREKAVELREKIVFQKNCSKEFLDELAAQSIKAGEPDFAERILTAVLERFPDDPRAKEIQADLLISKTPQDLETASSLVDSVIRDHPDRGFAFDLRGRIHEARSQYAEALADFRKALTTDPRNERLHESIARTSRRTGDTDSARIHEQLARELRGQR